MPLQAIMPHFSGGIATAMSNAMEGFREPGRIAEGILNRIEREDRETQRQKERQQDVDFRQKQLDTQTEQWQKSYDIQKAQEEDRVKELERKQLGQNMMAHVDAATADVMNRGALTPQGQQKLLGEYNRLVKAGVSPEDAGVQIGAMYESNKGGIRQVPMGLKDKIAAVEGINLGSGELQYDPTMALGQKDKLLTQLRSEYENQLNREQDAYFKNKDLGMKQQELGLRKRALEQEAKSKEPTISMYKLTPQGVATETVPASMMKEYVAMDYKPGKFGYAPQGVGGKYSDVKSVYSSPELTSTAAKLGPKDSDRLMKPLGEIQTRYKGIITPGELTNIGMTSVTDRSWWGDRSVNQQLMKNQIRDAILSSPKNTESETQVDKAVTAIMNKYW